jgi:hypothetical protein
MLQSVPDRNHLGILSEADARQDSEDGTHREKQTLTGVFEHHLTTSPVTKVRVVAWKHAPFSRARTHFPATEARP